MTESVIAALAEAPPGPVLSALLYRFDPAQLTPEQAVPVMRAWSRQRAHDHARMAATLARVAALSRHASGPVVGEWAGSEIAAALTWSENKAGRELEFAETLAGLPQVAAAFEAGKSTTARRGSSPMSWAPPISPRARWRRSARCMCRWPRS
jgi:hypothetical protein